MQEKQVYALAEKAFRQAGDFVRAEVAAARQLRLVAAGAGAGAETEPSQRLTDSEKRALLISCAFRLAAAARAAHEAPVPVQQREVSDEKREQARYEASTGRCSVLAIGRKGHCDC